MLSASVQVELHVVVVSVLVVVIAADSVKKAEAEVASEKKAVSADAETAATEKKVDLLHVQAQVAVIADQAVVPVVASVVLSERNSVRKAINEIIKV
jgi:hypothetical protein